MRISDWSSDVCSSDLVADDMAAAVEIEQRGQRPRRLLRAVNAQRDVPAGPGSDGVLRAADRERRAATGPGHGVEQATRLDRRQALDRRQPGVRERLPRLFDLRM